MDNIYLSLTTLPERLNSEHFRKVFNSLKNQTLSFKKLIINLSIKEFTYQIPDFLYHEENVIINESTFCGPCTKLLGSIDILPNDAIVIVLDDDIVMRNNFIKSLFDSYNNNPNKISSNFISVNFKFTEVQGFGGYIFNINNVRNIKQFYNSMPDCCRKIDDTWLSWCFKKIGVDVIKSLENDPWNNLLDIPNTDPHPDWNELCKNGDRENLTREALHILN